jgi:hypothetical protein
MEQRDIQPDAGGTPKRRNVKRQTAVAVVDAHERTERDFLSPAEMDLLTAVDSRTNPASTVGRAQRDLDLVSG